MSHHKWKEIVVLCCGDRHWTNWTKIAKEFDRLKRHRYKVVLVIEGEAVGADRLCRSVAEMRGIQVCGFFANWEFHQYAAGPIRNKKQLEFAINIRNGSDTTPGGAGYNVGPQHYELMVLAFHSNIEKSKGTANMVKLARKAGIKVRIIE